MNVLRNESKEGNGDQILFRRNSGGRLLLAVGYAVCYSKSS